MRYLMLLSILLVGCMTPEDLEMFEMEPIAVTVIEIIKVEGDQDNVVVEYPNGVTTQIECRDGMHLVGDSLTILEPRMDAILHGLLDPDDFTDLTARDADKWEKLYEQRQQD